LDVAHDATFSALLLMAVDMTADDEATVSEFLSNGMIDPFAKGFPLLANGDALAMLREFDPQVKPANVGGAVLSVPRVLGKPDLVQFAISLFARKPPFFTDIPILGGEFGVELMKSVNDPTFTVGIVRISGDKGAKRAMYRHEYHPSKLSRGVPSAISFLYHSSEAVQWISGGDTSTFFPGVN
jgi:hypothetical protein